jgi:hypothetical protein
MEPVIQNPGFNIQSIRILRIEAESVFFEGDTGGNNGFPIGKGGHCSHTIGIETNDSCYF